MNTAISDLNSFFNTCNLNLSKKGESATNEEVSLYHYTDTTVRTSTDNNDETEDRLDIADYRNPKNIFEKISNFFKHIFAPSEYEIFETNGMIQARHNEGLGSYYEIDYPALDNLGLYDDEKYLINGELDTEIHQGFMPDCGLISTCYAISQNPDGKDILKDSIKTNYNESGEVESYDVYFKGIDEKYTITQDEIDEALNKVLEFMFKESTYSYSTGDKDMLLLELAWSKCYSESETLKNLQLDTGVTTLRPISGNYPPGLDNTEQAKLFYAITGSTPYEGYISDLYNAADKYSSAKKENIAKIIEERNEFTLKDLINGTADKGLTFKENGIITIELNNNDTYEILTKPTEENNEMMTYKNKNTNQTYTVRKKSFIEYSSKIITQDEAEEFFESKYNEIKDSDARVCNVHANINDIKNINGENIELLSEHCYAIKSIDGKTITLTNPYDTSEDIVLDKNEFKKYATDVTFMYGDIDV